MIKYHDLEQDEDFYIHAMYAGVSMGKPFEFDAVYQYAKNHNSCIAVLDIEKSVWFDPEDTAPFTNFLSEKLGGNYGYILRNTLVAQSPMEAINSPAIC